METNTSSTDNSTDSTSTGTSSTDSSTTSSASNTGTETTSTDSSSNTSTTSSAGTGDATETSHSTSTTEPSTSSTPTSASTSTESTTNSNEETSKTEASSTANTNEFNATHKSETETSTVTSSTNSTESKVNESNVKTNSISTMNKLKADEKKVTLTPREEQLLNLKKHGIDMEKIMEVQKTPEIAKLFETEKLNTKAIGQIIKQGNLGTVLEFGKKFKETEKVANDLGNYIYSIGGVNNPEEYVRATYGVYLSIGTVLAEKDFGKFNMKMRYLIGVICNAKKEAKANELTFLKHDTSWKWGSGEFKKFHSLITTIFAACDKGIKNVGTLVDLDKVVTDLPAGAKANIKAFFTK